MLKLRNIGFLLCLLLVAIPALAQGSTPEATMMEEYTVNLSSSDTLGSYMVGPNGMSLYIFTVDDINQSNCTGRCLEFWPPLLVDDASAMTADESIPGTFGTITTDAGTQVTYNGMPLYYYQKDAAPGDTMGQGVTNNWWLAQPATIYIQKTPSLANVMVGANGMTVYIFTNDDVGSGISTCTGSCATNWPAVTVADESDVLAGFNVHGELGTITRDDGSYQVTYNGRPLYYYAKDAAVGDTMGQGVGGKWYTVVPDIVVISHNDTLGDILVNAIGGRTLYTFANDTAGSGTSACTGDCAKNWPPLTLDPHGQLKVTVGPGASGELSAITRDDGSLQVTYNGMPLYSYAQDTAPGDTLGQGVGDKWYVAQP